MDRLKNFQIEEKIEKSSTNFLIGQIDGEKAVFTIPPIKMNILEKIKNCNFTETDENTFTAKINVDSNIFCRLTFPATENHINKLKSERIYVKESYSEYLNEETLKTTWMDDIANGRSKGENIFLDSENYLIVSDYKWNPSYGVDNLYLLVIFKCDLKSIRDIEDLEMLLTCKSDILKVLSSFNLKEEDVAIYFHYRPSYFKLHIHVINISNNDKLYGDPIRNFLLDDVIKNLRIDSEYYKKDIYLLK